MAAESRTVVDRAVCLLHQQAIRLETVRATTSPSGHLLVHYRVLRPGT